MNDEQLAMIAEDAAEVLFNEASIQADGSFSRLCPLDTCSAEGATIYFVIAGVNLEMTVKVSEEWTK